MDSAFGSARACSAMCNGMTNERHRRFNDESDGLQSMHLQGLCIPWPERGLSDGALQPAWRGRGADVRMRRIQGRKVMTEAITILQLVVIYAGDLMLCIGALVFIGLVFMEDGL